MPHRARDLRLALALSILSILISGCLGAVAVGAAVSTRQLSLLGFGFDAAMDSVASVALVWRFRVEDREPHRADRVESIAEAVVGVVLVVLAVYLAFTAVRALIEGARPETSAIGTFVLITSLIVLPPLAYAKRRVATRLSSGALNADSVLTAMAALLALIGLIGLALTVLVDLHAADAAGALVVAAIMLREGYNSAVQQRA